LSFQRNREGRSLRSTKLFVSRSVIATGASHTPVQRFIGKKKSFGDPYTRTPSGEFLQAPYTVSVTFGLVTASCVSRRAVSVSSPVYGVCFHDSPMKSGGRIGAGPTPRPGPGPAP